MSVTLSVRLDTEGGQTTWQIRPERRYRCQVGPNVGSCLGSGPIGLELAPRRRPFWPFIGHQGAGSCEALGWWGDGWLMRSTAVVRIIPGLAGVYFCS